MGKATLIATIAIGFLALLLQNNAATTEHEVEVQNASQMKNMAVRELALEGRRLVLANWMASNGIQSSSPYTSIDRNGGTIEVTDYNLVANVLDFTIQASIDSSVHEIRSRYRWQPFPFNPIQLRVPALNPIIDPLAILNIDEIIIDDQSLEDLEDVIVDDLGLAGSLGDLGLGSSNISSELSTELSSNGHSVGVDIIDAADRSTYEDENGFYFAQQVDQAIQAFSLLHPELQMTVADGSALGTTFGITDGYEMLKVTGDLVVSNNIQGKGILLVEGNLIIPDGITFVWDGVLLVKPPADNLNPQIDLSGNVDIEGSVVAIQEGLPNTGHMDFTVMNDPTGNWYTAHGANTPWWEHTHDFSGSYGTQVVFQTNHYGLSDHDFASNFDQLMASLSSTDSVSLELYNPHNHGLGIISLDLLGSPPTSTPVAVGFDPIIANPVNPHFSTRLKSVNWNTWTSPSRGLVLSVKCGILIQVIPGVILTMMGLIA